MASVQNSAKIESGLTQPRNELGKSLREYGLGNLTKVWSDAAREAAAAEARRASASAAASSSKANVSGLKGDHEIAANLHQQASFANNKAGDAAYHDSDRKSLLVSGAFHAEAMHHAGLADFHRQSAGNDA